MKIRFTPENAEVIFKSSEHKYSLVFKPCTQDDLAIWFRKGRSQIPLDAYESEGDKITLNYEKLSDEEIYKVLLDNPSFMAHQLIRSIGIVGDDDKPLDLADLTFEQRTQVLHAFINTHADFAIFTANYLAGGEKKFRGVTIGA